jgi:small subunit ribosomal protein S34
MASRTTESAKTAAARAAAALQTLLSPAPLPRVLKRGKLNLYETLSRLPDSGVGARVHQSRWSAKGITDCYWDVTRCRTKNEGMSGQAWGKLVWRGGLRRVVLVFPWLTASTCHVGKLVSKRPERITGALKYHWKEGASTPTESAPSASESASASSATSPSTVA